MLFIWLKVCEWINISFSRECVSISSCMGKITKLKTTLIVISLQIILMNVLQLHIDYYGVFIFSNGRIYELTVVNLSRINFIVNFIFNFLTCLSGKFDFLCRECLISLKKVAELPILAARPLFTKPVTFRPSLATGLAFSEYIYNYT